MSRTLMTTKRTRRRPFKIAVRIGVSFKCFQNRVYYYKNAFDLKNLAVDELSVSKIALMVP
jgi:hypothetical protein